MGLSCILIFFNESELLFMQGCKYVQQFLHTFSSETAPLALYELLFEDSFLYMALRGQTLQFLLK